MGIALLLSSCTDNRVQTVFFTEGSCSECKKHIEKILSDVNGVRDAFWNPSTSQTNVVFDTTRTNESMIQKALAKGGFNTMYFEADTQAAKLLPACCRKVIEKKLIPEGGVHGGLDH